ncbi:hypothetical protein AAG906_001466 [Vitis piasezkii]
MEKTTLFHCLIKKMTVGNKTNPMLFLSILLFLVALDWFITFLDFCLSVRDLLQTCIAFISRARGACAGCSSSSSSLQPNENADDGDGELLARGDLEMVMEKLGFHCDPDEELGSSQFALLFEEEPSIGEVKEAFQVFDENRDGYVDAGELNKVLRTLGFVLASEVECEKMIQAFDDDGDGRIDFDEFTKLVEKSFC